mgnify:CR=1 FL=1|tara:strand:- start:426 stop:701 length:276 start_codon:yes stop_codon:yes gene_type:complete
MALKKNLEVNGSGIFADYIKLENILIDNGQDVPSVSVNLCIYKDKLARDEGKQPIAQIPLHITDIEDVNIILKAVYGALKKTEGLSGALDE